MADPKTYIPILTKDATFEDVTATGTLAVTGATTFTGAVTFAANIGALLATSLTFDPSVATAYATDGAIAIKTGVAKLTKGSAGAYTLAAPTDDTDDGKILLIVSDTAYAHTVTQTTPGFNGGSTASDVGTYATAAGLLVLFAWRGVWHVIASPGVTIA